jgi:F0F1-type ATP synthase membrane subunit b/b'
MKRRLGRSFFSPALFVLLAALPAAAAESDAISTPLGWTFRWIHFAIVFGLILFLLLKKAPPFFRGQAERISTAIAESARALAEAQRRKKEASDRLAGLDREVAAMRDTARRDSAAETERIRAGAREEVAKIDRAAQGELAAAVRAARSELKALAAHLAVTRAHQQLENQMTPSSEGQIFQAFVEQLSRARTSGSRN